MLEKSTRVVTDEERAVMDQEFVGKNGEKRKIEVRFENIRICLSKLTPPILYSLYWVAKN